MSLHTITMPVLAKNYASVPILLRQWREIFDKGHIQGPVLAVFTSITYCYAALVRREAGEDGKPFVIAAALTMGIVPYTWVFMSWLNSALFDAEEQSADGKSSVRSQDAEGMIAKWSTLHGVRSLFPLAGAVVGLTGMLHLV
jgi:noranthrone monooxygenase